MPVRVEICPTAGCRTPINKVMCKMLRVINNIFRLVISTDLIQMNVAAILQQYCSILIRVSDRTRLQKLFISVNTPFTRGFWAKIPVHESCAVGALLGDFGQLWAILGFSGLFLHKYAVYEGFLAIKYSFTVTISCKRVLSNTRNRYVM